MKKILFVLFCTMCIGLIGCTAKNGSSSGQKSRFEKEHDYVDLGLPSGLKWATCNVGATSPGDYGYCFAWGETTPKSDFTLSSYKYCDENGQKLFKYCCYSELGSVDYRTTLELSDDAARANWGGSWRMPTQAEWQELCDNCNSKMTTLEGTEGRLFTSKRNGKTIFLPAAGYRDWEGRHCRDDRGHYWSSSLYENNSYFALIIDFYFDTVNKIVDFNRTYGLSVRPVCP